MEQSSYQLGTKVVMKKPHPCGSNEWEIIRMGMDIRIKCIQCGRSVLMARRDFERSLKKIISNDNIQTKE